MADDTSRSTADSRVRVHPPTMDDAEGHRWEPRTAEQTEALATPAPPPRADDHTEDPAT